VLQTTDRRAIAYSEREREFTFAKNGTTGVLAGITTGRGTEGQETATYQQNGTGGNPTIRTHCFHGKTTEITKQASALFIDIITIVMDICNDLIRNIQVQRSAENRCNGH